LSAAISTRSYVLMRLAEVADALKSHGSERAELTKRIQGMAGDSASEVRPLRERRAYLAKRIAILHEEQKSLQAQRKAVNQTASRLSTGGTAKAAGADANS
jgi:hypothetical protein